MFSLRLKRTPPTTHKTDSRTPQYECLAPSPHPHGNVRVGTLYILVRIPLSTACPSRRGGRVLFLLLVYRNKSHHVIRSYYRDVIIIIINALIAVRVDWDAAVGRSVVEMEMEMVAPSCLRPTSISGIRSALFRHDLGREISNQYANQKLYYFLSINKTFTSNRNTHRQPVSHEPTQGYPGQ